MEVCINEIAMQTEGTEWSDLCFELKHYLPTKPKEKGEGGMSLITAPMIERIINSAEKGFSVSIHFKRSDEPWGSVGCAILLKKNGKQAGYYLPIEKFNEQMDSWEKFCEEKGE